MAEYEAPPSGVIYTGNPAAQTFHHQTFTPSEEYGYAVFADSLWFLVPGIVLVVLVAVWSCLLPECWPYRHKAPCGRLPAWLKRRHAHELTQCTQRAMVAGAALLSLLCVGLAVFGFLANEQQTRILTRQLPAEINALTTWKHNTLALLDVVVSDVDEISRGAELVGSVLGPAYTQGRSYIDILNNSQAAGQSRTEALSYFGINEAQAADAVTLFGALEDRLRGLAGPLREARDTLVRIHATNPFHCEAIPSFGVSSIPDVIAALSILPTAAGLELSCSTRAVEAQITGLGLDRIFGVVTARSEEVNGWRAPATLALLSALLVYSFYRTSLVIGIQRAKETSRMHSFLFVTTPLRSAVFCLLLLLVILYAGVMYGLAVGTAGVCADPNELATTLIAEYANAGPSDDLIDYYIYCGAEPNKFPDPLQTNLGTIATAMGEINSASNLLTVAFGPSCALIHEARVLFQQEQVTQLCGGLARTASALGDINDIVGWNPSPPPGRPNYIPGSVFFQTACASVNGLYEEALVLVCDHFLDSAVTLFGVFLGMFLTLLAGEALSKLTPFARDKRLSNKRFYMQVDADEDEFPLVETPMASKHTSHTGGSSSLSKGLLADYSSPLDDYEGPGYLDVAPPPGAPDGEYLDVAPAADP